jgi:hypothetical protein
MSTTQQPTLAPARRSNEDAAKARERAAAKATPRIADALRAGKRIPLAKLVELVAQDAAEQDIAELTDADARKIGNPLVQAGLLAGYTADKYGTGRWLARSTARVVRKRFDAIRKGE